MHCVVIEYFNSENGILVLKKKKYDNYDEYEKDLYIYNSLITNLIESCKESYLLDETQSYLLKVSESDKEYIKKILKNNKPSEKYNSIYHVGFTAMNYCLKDRNEEFAFKILYDISSHLKRGDNISVELYNLLNKLLHGDEDGFDNEYFVREYRIDSNMEDYVKNIMNTYPNEKEYVLPCKQKIK